jgi:hypothetical protein
VSNPRFARTGSGTISAGWSPQDVGSLEVGKRCDLLIWDLDHELGLGYSLGVNRLAEVSSRVTLPTITAPILLESGPDIKQPHRRIKENETWVIGSRR